METGTNLFSICDKRDEGQNLVNMKFVVSGKRCESVPSGHNKTR
jgi:hypothetical protein